MEGALKLLPLKIKMGFKTYKRTELDEQGNPYPILYMRLCRKIQK